MFLNTTIKITVKLAKKIKFQVETAQKKRQLEKLFHEPKASLDEQQQPL